MTRKKQEAGACLLIVISATALVAIGGAQAADGPIVNTNTGRVQGSAGDVVAFKGIPFAAAPDGEGRWRPPTPHARWNGVRSATEFGPACMQPGDLRKSEDCLHLNVWAPVSAFAARSRPQRLPVMVWTFGGGFALGSGDIDGTALARKGVVVVSFNYRVSTLGFLAHPQLSAESPRHVSGNYGLLDAIAALRWVRENIDAFGGDANRVTLWGQSSGASAITALMISAAANGLFQQVILESPGAMRHLKTLPEAEQQGMSVGRDILALRRLPAAELPLIRNLRAAREVRPLFEPRVIGPTLDGYLLKEEEREAFEMGRVNDIRSVLVGNNTDEGGGFTSDYGISTVEAYRDYLDSPEIFGRFSTEALALYPVTSDAEVPRAIADSFGDSQFYFGAQGIARAMTLKNRQVFRYLFTRKTNGGTGSDPRHSAELPYVMGSVSGSDYTADDLALSDLMMNAWVRFASTGNPNGGDLIRWPAYDVSTDPYLVFDTKPGIAHGLRKAQLDFIGRVQRASKD